MNQWSHALGALVLLVALHLSTPDAMAQGSLYVGASGFADIRRFGDTGSIYYSGADDDSSLDETGVGAGLRIGTFLHPRLSLELSVDAGTTTSSEIPDPYVILAIYAPRQTSNSRATTKFLSVSTVVGYHPPARGRLRLGYLAGLSFVRGVYRSDYPGYILAAMLSSAEGLAATSVPALPTIYPPPDLTVTQRDLTTGLTLGIEGAISLTKHLAIVPEVRAMTFAMPNDGAGVFLVRPGLGVRVAF